MRVAVLGIGVALFLAFAVHAGAQSIDPDCASRWGQAEKSGLVKGVGFVGRTLTTKVDATIYNGMSFDAKQGMMDTLSCLIAGPGKVVVDATFVSYTSNKVLASWDGRSLTVHD